MDDTRAVIQNFDLDGKAGEVVALVDKIVLIRNGRIERVGTHKELMLSSPYYSSLVRREMYGVRRTERLAA